MKYLLLALLLLTAAAFAQDPIPGTEIYLLDLESDSAEPVNISRHPGYDNQPAFSTDGEVIYFTRQHADGQTDIWCWHKDGTVLRLTETPESEYSPTPIPEMNAVSVVRVEQDQKQRLWSIDLTDSTFKLLLPELEPVGYHSWYSPRAVALFLLPDPFKLILYASKDEQLEVAKNIGRALHRNPQTGRLLYVDKSVSPGRVMSYDSTELKSEAIAKLFPGQEDFAVSRSGSLWTGNGSKLYRKASREQAWSLVTDLSAWGIHRLTRIAVSPDERYVAVVGTEPAVE